MGDENRQTRTLSIRVTRDEYQALLAKAELNDLTVATLVRRELLPILHSIVKDMNQP
jgi:hypothetical protein